jgi:hypothetical protein
LQLISPSLDGSTTLLRKADMSPVATFNAFRAALSRRAWNEAAELVHPDFATHRQASDLGLLGAYFASAGTAELTPSPAEAHLVVIKEGTDLSPYYARRVQTFPGHPTLGELAALTPSEYLARAMALCASRDGVREVPIYMLPVEILGVIEKQDDAQIELRLVGVKGEDEEEVAQIRLRKSAAGWRILPWATDFMAPIPWDTA